MRKDGTQASTIGRLAALSAASFVVFGIWAGLSAVLLADLARALDLSPGPLGVALFVGAASSMVSMWALGWTADRFGRRIYLVAVTCGFGIGVAGLAAAGSLVVLVPAFVVLYAATGLYDVGINAVAVDLEKLSGRRFMSFLHAGYAAGAVAGALGAGAMLSAGVGYRTVYLAGLIPLSGLISAFATTRFPVPRAGRRGEDPEAEATKEAATGRWDLYRNVPLLLIATVAGLGFASEGVMESWSGIYLRDALGFGALLGGSGVAVFFGAMAVGRLGTGWLVTRAGNRRTLQVAGLLAASGMALSLLTTLPALVVAGFLLVGLAISGMAPLAQSVAGDLSPGRAAAAVSVVITFGSGGHLISTVAVGGLAEAAGLRTALALLIPAGIAIFVLSARLRGAPARDPGTP